MLVNSGVGFIVERDFVIYWLACTITSLGFFLPTASLPTYACEVLEKPCQSSWSLMEVNLATTVGTFLVGAASDRCPVTWCIGVCSLGTALSVILLWGLMTNEAMLHAFSVFYGLFAGSYVASWPKVMDAVVGDGVSLRRPKAEMMRASWAKEAAASAPMF